MEFTFEPGEQLGLSFEGGWQQGAGAGAEQGHAELAVRGCDVKGQAAALGVGPGMVLVRVRQNKLGAKAVNLSKLPYEEALRVLRARRPQPPLSLPLPPTSSQYSPGACHGGSSRCFCGC